jgi:5-methylcytosine-specific restriction endonuclease McrA
VEVDYDERWVRRYNASQRRLFLKERAIEYKGGKCQICGYNRCTSAMVFHHTNPAEKDFNISERQGWKSVVAELDKCELLCSNCHAEVHAGYYPTYLQEDEPYED